MFLGRVIGQVWATRKSADLEGKRLLVVEALADRRNPGAPKVVPVVAADPPGAALDEYVLAAFGQAAPGALARAGRSMEEADLDEMMRHWDAAKAQGKKAQGKAPGKTEKQVAGPGG